MLQRAHWCGRQEIVTSGLSTCGRVVPRCPGWPPDDLPLGCRKDWVRFGFRSVVRRFGTGGAVLLQARDLGLQRFNLDNLVTDYINELFMSELVKSLPEEHRRHICVPVYSFFSHFSRVVLSKNLSSYLIFNHYLPNLHPPLRHSLP